MTPLSFKRVLHAGMKGRDVKAVKIALKHAGYGAKMTLKTSLFGAAMKTQLERFQKHSHLTPDGIYGPSTHAALTPDFTNYARKMYERQKVEIVPGTAQDAAKRLLELHAQGKYRDDRGTELAQIEATALGHAVRNAAGESIHIQAKVMQVLVWLIDVKEFTIGTFALCADHGFDSENGHAGGRAVDISSINGNSILASAVRADLLRLLNDLQSGEFRPWQLISGGYAGHEDAACLKLCIPQEPFYGSATLADHTNHIHCGY